MKKCIVCQKEVVKKYSESSKYFETKKFCSSECYWKYKSENPLSDKAQENLNNLIRTGRELGGYHKGHKHSDITKKIMSDKKKGMRLSPATEFKKGRPSESLYNWKGEEAGYGSKHDWIKRKYGKARFCSNFLNCNGVSTNYQWANLSGKYLRDLKDWVQLCVSCHTRFDKGKIALRT